MHDWLVISVMIELQPKSMIVAAVRFQLLRETFLYMTDDITNNHVK